MTLRLTVTLVLVGALALGAGESKPYDRRDWMPSGWIDEDSDCQHTRTEVLIRDAVPRRELQDGGVYFADAKRECNTIAAGVWIDPYTSRTIRDPGQIDIDHVIPLAWAHANGGDRWTREQRRAYANDLRYPRHLRAVLASENRKKSAKGPDAYRPGEKSSWCWYGEAWATIIVRWGLTVDAPTRAAIVELTDTCTR